MLFLGLFVVSYSLYALMRHDRLNIISAHWAWLAGLAGGIASAVFGSGGPPYVIYLSQRGLSKAQFRATPGLTILTSISLRVIAFLITGLLLDPKGWMTALPVLPPALLRIWVARK